METFITTYPNLERAVHTHEVPFKELSMRAWYVLQTLPPGTTLKEFYRAIQEKIGLSPAGAQTAYYAGVGQFWRTEGKAIIPVDGKELHECYGLEYQERSLPLSALYGPHINWVHLRILCALAEIARDDSGRTDPVRLRDLADATGFCTRSVRHHLNDWPDVQAVPQWLKLYTEDTPKIRRDVAFRLPFSYVSRAGQKGLYRRLPNRYQFLSPPPLQGKTRTGLGDAMRYGTLQRLEIHSQAEFWDGVAPYAEYIQPYYSI